MANKSKLPIISGHDINHPLMSKSGVKNPKTGSSTQSIEVLKSRVLELEVIWTNFDNRPAVVVGMDAYVLNEGASEWKEVSYVEVMTSGRAMSEEKCRARFESRFGKFPPIPR